MSSHGGTMLRTLAVTLFAGALFSAASSASTPGQPACHNGSYRSGTNDLLVISGATRLRYFLLDGRTGYLRRIKTVPGSPRPASIPPAQQPAALAWAHATPSRSP